MSLIEPTAGPAESPRTSSRLRSLPAGPAGVDPDWADDDRLDELFSAWASAAVATDATPDGFPAAADDRSRPVAAEPTEARPTEVRPTAATPSTRAEMDPFAWPTLEPHDAFVDTASAADEARVAPPPATAWSRTDDDIIPARRRRGRRG